MENKRDKGKTKIVSNGNVIEDSLTAEDRESKQHGVSKGGAHHLLCSNSTMSSYVKGGGQKSPCVLDLKIPRPVPKPPCAVDLKKKIVSKPVEPEKVRPRTYMCEDPDLYLKAKNGDVDHFSNILQRTVLAGIPEDHILSRLNPAGNTFIHVAAKHKKQDMVKFIASRESSLVLAENFSGETVLHLATKRGDESMVKVLLEIPFDKEAEKRDLLMAKNAMGNTALHQALLSGYESIASFLIQQDSVPLYELNNHRESAIYLAVKAGLVKCVSSILAKCTDERRLNLLFEEISPIQAAIEKNDRVVFEAIINANRYVIKMTDKKGRNPLHFAASLGNLEAAQYLQQKCVCNATTSDLSGKLPIHLAALEGHVDVIQILLQVFLEAEELLDNDGCNILHTAASSGRHNVLSFVLKNPKLESLINMKDKFGNTPLHIAAKNDHPMIVSTLTWDPRVDIMAVNNDRKTALDVAEDDVSANPTFKKRLTWPALKAASVPQNSNSSETVNVNLEVYKERVNTLLLVATLVATVTFAAGFTMPGGYISSETGTDLGMATMWRDTVFHVFVLCDTIAMYTAILVVTTLIWAQLGDTTFIIYALELAAPLLGVALFMMSMAFTAGVTIVVTKLRWLQITLLAISTSFIALLLLLLLPLCAPLTSRSRILRYLSYYPFCLLVLVSSTKPNH